MLITTDLLLLISGTRGTITDEDVRLCLYEIVNNEYLTLEQKENWLDALCFKVGNCHAAGLAANIIEDICNEGTHLRYPSWRGRYRDWVSVQSMIETE